MTLRDFHNSDDFCLAGIQYLWFTSVGAPTGVEFRQNTNTDDPEEYCDFAELELLERLWDLEGHIEGTSWVWDGCGHPRDQRNNSILKIVARP